MITPNAVELPWWRRPLFATQPAQPRFNVPVKGNYNGICRRFGCENSEAVWFNISTGRYYCHWCARTINEVRRQQGRPALCELHRSR